MDIDVALVEDGCRLALNDDADGVVLPDEDLDGNVPLVLREESIGRPQEHSMVALLLLCDVAVVSSSWRE